MALDIPETEKSVIDAAKSDVQAALPGSAPFLQNSFMGAQTVAFGARVFDFYRVLELAERQTWWDTATDDQLERWGSILGLTRNSAVLASGKVAITGTVGTSLGSGIKFRDDSGRLYTTTNTATITSFSQSVASITRTGSTATVEFVDNHEIATGLNLAISGVNEAEYNGAFPVAVTGPKTLTYEVAGAPTTPATGTIIGSYTSALIDISSDQGGQDQNLGSGATLTITSPVAGIDDIATVSAFDVAGGADTESDSDFRSRISDNFRGIPANFNADTITITARMVPGVTRVFVEPASPVAGQVTVYFLRDNDTNIIPSPTEVSDVNAVLQAIRPASMLDEDLIVDAPSSVTVNFSVGNINPNTDTMKDSIRASLEQLFREGVSVGQDLQEDAYRGAVFGTVDTTTGQLLTSFDITSPTGDITIASGEIPVLGTVTIS